MEYLNAFLCGGVLCAIGQILIDKTKLTPARILTGYVVAGVILSAVGLYQPLLTGAALEPLYLLPVLATPWPKVCGRRWLRRGG